MRRLEVYKRTLADIGSIIARHVFLLVNGVIFSVVVLLYLFGNKEAAVFLGIITFFNVTLGIVQDTRARLALETLQMLTALRVLRLGDDGGEKSVLAEDILRGDKIKLKLGDQVPCDGVLLFAEGLEVSEALVTGESDSLPRKTGEKVGAGDIVTSGLGVLEAQTNFNESRMAKMTEDAKRYAAKPSPIQTAVERVIKYSGYILLLLLPFVVARGLFIHEPYANIVMNIGALASIIVPQGLVVITTLLFAFGAASYSKRHVLFQEINATEKLGRIKNLCLDKTGTLTENSLVVEDMYIPENASREECAALASLYIRGSQESSQTIMAVATHLGDGDVDGEIIEAFPFSSWRQYGALSVRRKGKMETILVGSPDTFLPCLKHESDRTWLQKLIDENTRQGKRLLAVARSTSPLPSLKLPCTDLSLVAIFVFRSSLREGIKEAITFFQDRGVSLRIISGDNPETVRAVAREAGVLGTDAVVTGKEMEKWEPSEFDTRVREHTIFARILPEQKVRIVTALKKDGFTAMVGDGANDALAIKQADLGIAMFDGAPATRRLAGIILMGNSFTALPGGVRLADNFIKNIEIFAGIFINQSVLGLFFFLIISAFGYTFPLTPLNVTLINYFTVGIPGMLIGYWAISTPKEISPTHQRPFLSRVMPFVLYSAIVESIAAALVFLLSPPYLKVVASNTLIGLAFIVSGFIFFLLAPSVYRSKLTKSERWQVCSLGVGEILFLYVILQIPFLVHFFDLTIPHPSIKDTGIALLVLLLFGGIHYAMTKLYFSSKNA